MEDKQMDIKGKVKRTARSFWRSLFAEERMPEEPPPPEPEPEPVQSEERRGDEESSVRDRPKGALLEVLRRWKSTGADIALGLPEEGQGLPLSGVSIERERLRLSLALERDAKKRLSALQAAENKEDQKLGPACKVYLSEDRMVAWMFLFPPSDPGMPLQIGEIGVVMQQQGISTGIDSVAIAQLIQEVPYFHLIPVAFGTPPTEGRDGKIVEHYLRELPKEVKIDENGQADYRSVNYVQLVSEGDVICDIIPPEEGQAGLRVDGKVVEPKKVRIDKIPSGKNTAVSEDGLHLLATSDGHIQFFNGAFHVRPVLTIQGNVDYSTGNVNFNGDVHITGNVLENFCVRAAGSITIDGLVEAAFIESGGDLLIANGVLGNYKAVLKSKGCIRVKFLENCVAYASGGIFADCTMSSQLFSDDIIQVTSGRGAVIGGSLVAAHEIKVTTIGSRANRMTSILLGVFPFSEENAHANRAELEEVREEIDRQETELKGLLERQGLTGGPELSKAQMRKSVLALKELQLLKRINKQEEKDQDLSKCRLDAGSIYPITEVTIGEGHLVFRENRSHCKIKYDVKLEELLLL